MAKLAERANADLATVQSRCSERLLDESDIADAQRLRELASRLARRGGGVTRTAWAQVHGGFVPNSYGYSAETTRVYVAYRHISVARIPASSRPRGIGPCETMGYTLPACVDMRDYVAPRLTGWHPVVHRTGYDAGTVTYYRDR